MSDHMDPKMRELTYRLIAMAPEAPPFPEESMVQLNPAPAPAPRRRPLVWVAAAAVIALVVVGVPLLLFGPDGETPQTTLPPATATTVPDSVTTTLPDTTVPPDAGTTLEFSVYLFSDDLSTRLGDPALVAVRRTQGYAGQVDDVLEESLSGAIASLVLDPVPAGFGSAIPAGITEVTVGLSGGVATVDLPAVFESGGGSASMFGRLAQVVFTATQFPEVDSVLFMIDGEVVDVFSGEGLLLEGPQTRADYFGTDQLIYVDTPAIGSTVSSPITISGDANTFEATVEFEVTTAGGEILASSFTTATCGSGCWGEFLTEASYTLAQDTAGFVTVFASSAEDGSRTNVITYPVTLLAAEGGDVTGEAPSYLSAGFDPMRGAGYYPGRIVTTSPLLVQGGTDADAAVTVNGNAVTLSQFGGFSAEVDLVDGENTVVVAATRGGQTVEETLVVRYLPDATIEFTYLTQVASDQVIADYAQWLTGDEANQAAFEDGVIGSVEEGVPNDYYIRNVNPQLRTLPLAPDIDIVLATPAPGPVASVAVTMEEWLSLFKDDGTPWDYEAGDEPPIGSEPHWGYFGAGTAFAPYWVTLDADGTVIQIEQQYIP